MSSPKPSQQAFIRNFHCLPNIQMFTYLSMFPLKKKIKSEFHLQKKKKNCRCVGEGSSQWFN